ncbi:MAG: TerD family protein [Bacteroidales bacterium]|nr:TerD family protein [Bacteroidales bacterium]
MAINLTKGQKVDLTKKGDTLDMIHVGLGWDPVSAAPEKKRGFFKKVFSAAPEIDCDASVILLNNNDKMRSGKDLIYFGNLKSKCGSVQHTGDNLTGEGEGDDEVIYVSLKKLPGDVEKLVFVVNIYDCVGRKQHFGMIQNAFIRILDKNSGKELIKYQLSNEYADKTSLLVGEIYRKDGEWKFGATGVGTNDTSIKSIINQYK